MSSVNLAQKGPSALPYPLQPAADGAHNAQFGLRTRVDPHDFAVPELIFFAAAHQHAKASRLERHIFDLKTNELACAKRPPKPKKQQRPITVTTRTDPHGLSDLNELLVQQRRGAFFPRAVDAAHAAFELADFLRAVRTWQPRRRVRLADRHPRSFYSAQLSTALQSAVRARLLEGPDRAFAIERLTLKLQQFESGLLKNMLRAKRPEDILQVAVNYFIFAEGLYPITQFVVGRGRLDTMVEVPAEASGIRCILIELKQAVKNPTRKNLQALVANARVANRTVLE